MCQPFFFFNQVQRYNRDMLTKLDDLLKTLQMAHEELVKMSNYGPKKGGQYTPTDNARRKMNNTGDQTGFGQNVNTKAYSTKPGQLSAKDQAAAEASALKRKNRKQPVKTYSPEEKAALATKMGLKKSEEIEIHQNGQWSLRDDDK